MQFFAQFIHISIFSSENLQVYAGFCILLTYQKPKGLLKKERQALILHHLDLHNKVVSLNLSKELNVSEDTIRRDLQQLADQGKCTKVHGGALSIAFNGYHLSEIPVYSRTEKNVIARKAIDLIENGMVILTSGGTTILEMIHQIPYETTATIFTGSIPVVNACINHPGLQVVVIGDELSKDSRITVGPEAIRQISQINADLCFLGTNAMDNEKGITENDWQVAQVKKAMVSSSKKVVSMIISEKLKTVQPIQVCGLQSIDYLITELRPSDRQLKLFKQPGLNIL